jgi:hypothetical protein
VTAQQAFFAEIARRLQAGGMAALGRGELDWSYLEKWADELGVRDELARLRADAESYDTG